MALPEESPVYGPFFGVMGAAAAIIFSGKEALNPYREKTPRPNDVCVGFSGNPSQIEGVFVCVCVWAKGGHSGGSLEDGGKSGALSSHFIVAAIDFVGQGLPLRARIS